MNRAKLPIEGLTYKDENFYLDGSTIENLSSSKAMKLAVAIARTLAGPTKLICIDGAELLDDETYEALRNEIDNDGFTYFITKVGEAFDHPADKVVTMKQGQAV